MTTTISGSNGIVFPDATSMQTGQQAVKAWVNFNASGTLVIRNSYNVSSVTDISSGISTINFTTAMVDTNYGFAVGISSIGSTSTSVHGLKATEILTTSIKVLSSYTNPTADGLVDAADQCVTIFR